MNLSMMARRVGEVAVFAALAVVGVFALDTAIARTSQSGSSSQMLPSIVLTCLALVALVFAIVVGSGMARGGLDPRPGQLLSPRRLTIAGGIIVAGVIGLLLVHRGAAAGLWYLSGSALNAFYLAWLRAVELRELDA